MFRVEGGLGFKHGASDSEEPIGDAARGAAMAMTALAQFRVAGGPRPRAVCDRLATMSRWPSVFIARYAWPPERSVLAVTERKQEQHGAPCSLILLVFF
jgi:hypothetical protein